MLTRRRMLAGLGATTVLGFNPSTRLWVGVAHAATPFDRIPYLDGEVLTDPASFDPYATDAGNIVHEAPLAVLRPGSVEDIQKMVRFCRRHDIRVAGRGQGHATFGQAQVAGGLVVDMSTLHAIHTIGPDHAEVDAGVTWKTLCAVSVPQGVAPPVLTGYINLSVGGTLSVGGISATNREGAQVDRVRELEIVTGRGDVERCSPRHHRDLFEAALGGLGQCGIITRAVLDMVPAMPMVRIFQLEHTDNATFFRDLRKLLDREELNDVFTMWLPDGKGGFIYQLNLAKFYDPAVPPDDAHLLRDLEADPAQAQMSDVPYGQYILRVDVVIEALKQNGLWHDVQHPWFDVFLPDWSIEQYLEEVLPTLTPEDVGPTGFMLLFPQKRSRLRRPLLRVPNGREWIFLFDILTAAPAPGHDVEFESKMLRRNRELFEKARRFGGTRYPIGATPFHHFDWVLHYWDQWFRLLRLKRKYDPDRILTPGPGIF